MADIEYQKQLINYFKNFVTEERIKRFDAVIKNRTRHITIALEDIYQSHNTSAVLRTCDCFGIQDVHIIENKNKYSVNPDIALGSSKWLNIYEYNSHENNTLDCINKLKEKGYKVFATSPHADALEISEINLNQKITLLFGTEKEGLSEIALKNADEHVKIPMYGFTESFNISVSAALSLFYLTEKLRHSDINWRLNEDDINPILIEWYKNTIKDADLLEHRFLSGKSKLIK